MNSKPLYQLTYKSPIGIIRISADDEFICELTFIDDPEPSVINESPLLIGCAQQLDEYFSEERKTFSLPLHPKGTEFQMRIWQLLQEIPYGKTISYLDLAIKAGNRKSIRAVGLANGANKLAIIIPCHRVIGSSGKLIGYDGGLWRKEWLLKFERKDIQPELFPTEQLLEKA
jgi:methylated-DNA-[protein]-cysteine S-methyltransferase